MQPVLNDGYLLPVHEGYEQQLCLYPKTQHWSDDQLEVTRRTVDDGSYSCLCAQTEPHQNELAL